MTNLYWQKLGITPTSDKRTIKRAYSIALKSCHPEDDPEGFQQLNEAYQWALSYAADAVAEDEAPAPQNSDDIPSELHLDESSLNGDDTGHSEETSATIQDFKSDTALYDDTESNNEKSCDIADTRAPEGASDALDDPTDVIDAEHLAINQFIRQFQYALQEPNARKDKRVWAELIQTLEEAGFSFKEGVFFAVFAGFIEHFSDPDVATSGAFIPKGVVIEFAENLNWKANELTLLKTFEREDITLVMTKAYGHSESNAEYEEQTGWRRYSSILANVAMGLGLMIALTAVFSYLVGDKTQEQAQQDNEQPQVVDKTAWADSLSVCTSMSEPEPGDALDACEQLAVDGWLKAQYALAWLYSRDTDYRDWQKSFEYLKAASQFDTHAELLSQIMLFRLGNDEDDTISGEKGIKALANEGFAPAQAFQAVMYFRDDHVLKATSNPVYLLETAYKSGRSLVTEFEMATFYINGFSNRSEPYQRALNLLMDIAKQDFPVGTNNVAWFLATLDENPLTTPDYAVELASEVVNDPDYAKNIAYIDTLAATYAAAGDFEQAVRYQSQAIDLINQSNVSEQTKQAQISSFSERLALYEDQQRTVEYALKTEKQAFFDNLNRQLSNRLFLRLRQLAQQQN